MTWMVVHDPIGKHPIGTVLAVEHMRATAEFARGVVALPIDRDMLGSPNPVVGYFRRDWGFGVPFNAPGTSRGCPMLLMALPSRYFLHWAARIVPVERSTPVGGQIRLVASTALQLGIGGGISHDDLPKLNELGPPDDQGGWVIRGRNRISIGQEGFIAFDLYGPVQNARVLWSAVTQSERPE